MSSYDFRTEYVDPFSDIDDIVNATCVIRLPPMGLKVYVEKQPVAWEDCCVEYWCEKTRKCMSR